MAKNATQSPADGSKPKNGNKVANVATYKSKQVVPQSGVYTISGGDGTLQGKVLCLVGETFYGTGEGDPPLNFSLESAVPHQKDVKELTPPIW